MVYRYLIIGVVGLVLSLTNYGMSQNENRRAEPAQHAVPATPPQNKGDKATSADPAIPAEPGEKESEIIEPEPPSTLFRMGDRVETTENLKVREVPLLAGRALGIQSVHSYGTVLGGSVYADGYHWWNINYDTGYDGWSVEDGLRLASVSTNTPTPTVTFSPTPTASASLSPTPVPTPIPDVTPPTILNLRVFNIGPFSVDISWDTSEPANGRIQFVNGLCPNGTNCLTPLVSEFVTNHIFNIFDLLPGSKYFFNVQSNDSSGNLSVSSGSFQTLTGSVPTPTASASFSPTPTVTSTPTPTSTVPILQPGGGPTPNVKVGAIFPVDFFIQNLTCRFCEYNSPSTTAKVYYTAWYPNDGPQYTEIGPHYGEQTFNVPPIPQWSSMAFHWQATANTVGRYYFVVIVDPNNLLGAYRMHRAEFYIVP